MSLTRARAHRLRPLLSAALIRVEIVGCLALTVVSDGTSRRAHRKPRRRLFCMTLESPVRTTGTLRARSSNPHGRLNPAIL